MTPAGRNYLAKTAHFAELISENKFIMLFFQSWNRVQGEKSPVLGSRKNIYLRVCIGDNYPPIIAIMTKLLPISMTLNSS